MSFLAIVQKSLKNFQKVCFYENVKKSDFTEYRQKIKIYQCILANFAIIWQILSLIWKPMMKPVFNECTPKFKTTEEKSFKRTERSQEYSTDRLQRSPKGKLSLSRQNQRIKPENIYPTEARKANGQGQVTINVKQSAFLQKEKKTGPLSPRAPEKIKKNRAEEMKIYGENSCLTLFAQRPTSIVRLWATVEGAKKLGDMLSYLAEHKKAYHIVSREEMEKVTGSDHHGDVCLLVKKNRTYSLEGYLQLAHAQDCLVLLDGVNNAQNIGGLVRTCAFYGVKGIISENGECLNSSSAARVAEGGLEFVHTLETKNKQIALQQLRQAGYQIVHLTRHKQAPSLAKVKLAKKVVFVLSEVVSNHIEYSEDTTVQLSVNNPLASGLNVAVNAGVLLNQWYVSQVL